MPGDGRLVNEAIRESFSDLQAWMDWAQHVPTIDETNVVVQRAFDSFKAGTDFSFFAFLKSSNEFVLAAGLHPRDWNVLKFEIGYWCRTEFHNQGYVTEAVRELTRIGFAGVKANKIEIRCEPRNLPSQRVAEKCGYHLEAVLRNDKRRPDGELRDTLVYSLLSQEYKL